MVIPADREIVSCGPGCYQVSAGWLKEQGERRLELERALEECEIAE